MPASGSVKRVGGYRSAGWTLRACAFAVGAGLIAFVSMTSNASVVNYGNFSGLNYDFNGVSEASGTDPAPLFGTPTISNDTLSFTPVNFSAYAQNNGIDLTDGTLTVLTIAAKGNASIDAVTFFEAGDYALVPPAPSTKGTAETRVLANLAVFLSITEIDGVAITPINVSSSTQLFGTDITANRGIGLLWSGGKTVDLDSVAAANGFSGRITKVTLNIDNTLFAESESNTEAFIAKKQFQVTVIPEPGSLALLALGSTMMLYGRFRIRKA
jgi:hypothetical protein